MQLQAEASTFVRYCESIRKLSRHSVRAYELDLASVVRFLGAEATVSACDRTAIQEYVRYLFEVRGLRESSVQRHLATLRAFFRWLNEERDQQDPFRDVRIRIRMPKRLPRVISRPDLRRLLIPKELSVHTFSAATAYIATEMLFATGMRVGELASLSDHAVNVEDGTITVIGKGDRQRWVFVPDDVKALLRNYRVLRDRIGSSVGTFLVTSRGAAPSTQMIRRLIRLHCERYAVRERVTPHMFRHSVATYLLEEGVDIRYVQRLLGHRSISTTAIYTSVADASLKSKIIERHPRRSIVGATDHR